MAKRRITRVTTTSGDGGQTSLATGRQLSKTDALLDAVGDIDELNSHVGMLVALLPDGAAHDNDTRQTLGELQQNLFDLGAVLALEGAASAPPPATLDAEIARINVLLPPLTEFVLPGGTRAAAQAHICRTVCRRAERRVWALAEDYAGVAVYLNRASDYLFVLARLLNQDPDHSSVEPQWRGTTPPSA